MRRPTALLALLLAAVALSGCTGAAQDTSAGSFEGADRDVVEVIDDLKASRDPEEICTQFLTQELAKSVAAGGKDCQDEVQATIRDVANTDLDVKKVTISGSSATADVEQDGETATFELERTGDGWRLSSFGES